MSDAPINCPKCGGAMRQLDTDSITVDRCEECYGIWLDQGERLKILGDDTLADAIDIGPAEKGAEMDSVREVDCPRCHQPMAHVRDRAQKHIGFEFCRECDGSFFDAGELRDLNVTTISERIRAFFGR